MKKSIIYGAWFLLILFIINGCSGKPKDVNICGDGICTLTEDCNNCLQDCACDTSEYCDAIGICRTDVCGDEICSDNEKITNACCQDCGCIENEVCNKVTQKCQERIEVSEDIISKTVNNYLTENKIDGETKEIIDVYHKDQIVKQVTIDCAKEEIPYPCMIILFINEKGELIEEIRTT